MRFGIMQIKVGLVYLLRKYEFLVCDKTAIPPTLCPGSFITTAKEGINLVIRRRSPT